MLIRKFGDVVKCDLDFSHDPGCTKSDMADECDINKIISGFVRTGVAGHVTDREPRFEYAPSLTYFEAACLVKRSQESFMSLPAEVRAVFRNDPVEFLSAVESTDPAVIAQCRDLGLIPALPVPDAPIRVQFEPLPSGVPSLPSGVVSGSGTS